MTIDLSTYQSSRRRLIGQSAALGIGLVAAGRFSVAALAQGATPSTGTDNRLAMIVDAANTFLETLTDDERLAVLFDWSDDEQKARWSNFPEGLFERDGLMWGTLTAETQAAWLALMQATLSEQGYARVIAEWAADQYIADNDGPWNGGGGAGDDAGTGNGGPGGTPPSGDGNGPGSGNGGPGGEGGQGQQLGQDYYWIALIGDPSTSSPWQWQFGGHHITVNATATPNGIALTPSFIGVQPSTYTNADGTEVRPLGDIRDAALALVTSLDAEQQAEAVLGETFIDLVLGPGADGEAAPDEGLIIADMTAEQQEQAVALISLYTGLLNDDHAAARLAEVTDLLDQTRFAWFGPTDGSAAYFRVAGPTIVIEYAPQSQLTDDPADHIHGIYRDPSNDYGIRYMA